MTRFAIIFLIFSLFCGATVVQSINLKENFIRVPLVSYTVRERREVTVDGNRIEFWNDRNIQYAINITVGTPPQHFVMDFDTGSSDIWIPSEKGNCPYLCKSINKYDSGASSTYEPIEENSAFTIGYEVGGVSGSRARETIRFAGLTIENQIIGVATEQAINAYNYPFDGLLGFAWSGAVSSTDKDSTVLQNLQDQGQIEKRLACVKLYQRNEQPGGELLIGGCDVEAEHWGRVSGNGLWQIPIDKVEAVGPDGDIRASICGPDSTVPNCQVALDSGAAPIGGPSYLIDPIAKGLGATKYDRKSNDYIVDCDDETLGNMEFTFGTFKVVMTPGDYLKKSRNKCKLGLQHLNNLDVILLGDPFLRKVTLILDQENDRAGLANSDIDDPVERPSG